jgi:adenosylhomocysteinase
MVVGSKLGALLAANPRIAWARANMALVGAVGATIGTALDGLRIGVSLHLEPKTAVLLRVLADAGADIVATGNLGTTQHDIVAALRDDGLDVFGSRSDDPRAHHANLERVIDSDPDLLLDNGADLYALVLDRGVPILGGTEETTSGAMRLRGELGAIDVPVIVINDSPLKAIVENKHAVGQSIVEGFLHVTNLMPQGRRFVVYGYGWCGRGIAHYARSVGGQVAIVEIDEIKALEAAVDGYRVLGADEAPEWGSVFITATGAEGVLAAADIEKMAEDSVLVNAGHFDREIDVPGLAEMAAAVEAEGPSIERYRLASGKSVVLLAEGRMFNLAADGARGNSIESMDLGFSLQALSLARVAVGGLDPGPQSVPDDINRQVAAAMVERMMS